MADQQLLDRHPTEADTASVPIIDIAPFFGDDPVARQQVADGVGAACRSIGFIVVTGHGVPQAAIDAIYGVTRDFYQLPSEEKMKVASPIGDRHEAYAPNANPYDASPIEDRPVMREQYHSYRYDTPEEAIADGYPEGVRTSLLRNLWPAEPAGFEPVWKGYFALMEELAGRMLHIFAVALGLPEDWFDDKVDQHLGTMAANRYPAQPVAPADGQIRARAHVDFSTLTILYQDDMPGGLQVHRRGVGWIDVPAIPGSYVVNLGDLMGRWTNDQWVATPHRVINPPREQAMTERYSLPFFHLPNHDAIIEPIPTCVSDDTPAKYLPVSAGDWAEARREGRSANFARIRP
jgi:isopenicillin N synthase-like dioxygenase